VLLSSVLVHVLGVMLVPELWLELSGKEATFEHLGHAVIFLSALAWLRVTRRREGAPRWISTLVSVYLGFCLLEEVDWGAVYGIDLGYTRIQRWTSGSPNLHNAPALERGPLGWSVVWLSLPMVVYFLAGLWTRARTGSLASVLPTKSESILFLSTVLVSVVFDGLHLLHWRLGYVPRAETGGRLGDALGWFQIAFYVLWILVALRLATEGRVAKRVTPPD
jgi:hypothetical protein